MKTNNPYTSSKTKIHLTMVAQSGIIERVRLLKERVKDATIKIKNRNAAWNINVLH